MSFGAQFPVIEIDFFRTFQVDILSYRTVRRVIIKPTTYSEAGFFHQIIIIIIWVVDVCSSNSLRRVKRGWTRHVYLRFIATSLILDPWSLDPSSLMLDSLRSCRRENLYTTTTRMITWVYTVAKLTSEPPLYFSTLITEQLAHKLISRGSNFFFHLLFLRHRALL